MANDNHSRDVVREAIKTLRDKRPTKILSMDDVVTLLRLCVD